jgi:hypothetical protein
MVGSAHPTQYLPTSREELPPELGAGGLNRWRSLRLALTVLPHP